MILAILLISVFNTGLILILAGGMLQTLKQYIADTAKCINDNTDKDIEASTTAIFNMDSIKTTAERKGKFEI